VELRLADGHLISGRYRISRFIGAGGMGEVYEAEDVELSGSVALKIIRPDLLEDPHALTRFRREIQLARQVTHPNVCRVFDVGRDAYAGRELVYFTMEFLAGETLQTWLKTSGRTADSVLPVCRQIAEGLDALHGKGILHRDLKPGNVMMAPSPSGVRAIIGDFGLARTFGPEHETATQTGWIAGTPAYMAPEVLAGSAATPAADMWAFGLIVHEVATGKRVSAGQPPDASLPPAWGTGIQRCLALDPALRPKSASSVIAAFSSSPAVPKPYRARSSALRLALVLCIAAAAVGLGVKYLWTPHNEAEKSLDVGSDKAGELLAKAYKTENLASAIAMLEHSATAPGASAYEHAELGVAYLYRYDDKLDPQDLERSHLQNQRAIALDPGLASPYATEASYNLERGHNDLAQVLIEKALSVDKNEPGVFAAQSDLFLAQGRRSDAEASIERAIDLAPNEWRWHEKLGSLYRLMGQFEKAGQEFETAVRLSPDNPKELGRLAGIYLQQSRYEDARKTFEKAIVEDPQYRFYSGLGATLMLEGKYADAARAFREALNRNSQSYIAWANLGSSYSWAPGEKSNAADAYKQAIQRAQAELAVRPKDAILLARIGDYYAAISELRKAIPLIRQALALQPDSPEVTYTAAEAYEILHRRDDALHWMQEAVRLGYPIDYIRRSPELTALRSDPRYRLVESAKKR
jgi:serine/threonine protein kinase